VENQFEQKVAKVTKRGGGEKTQIPNRTIVSEGHDGTGDATGGADFGKNKYL
jgi:hypothetical protein